MSAVVTKAPIAIDPVNFIANPESQVFFERNGKLYCVTAYPTGNPGGAFVYESIDKGSTWQNITGTIPNSPLMRNAFAAAFRLGSAIVFYYYFPVIPPVFVANFDVDSRGWSAPYGTVAGPTAGNVLFIAVLSTGVIRAFYTGPLQTNVMRWAELGPMAASWTSIDNVFETVNPANSIGQFGTQLVVDASNGIHSALAEFVPVIGAKIFQAFLDSAGVSSAASYVPGIDKAGADVYDLSVGSDGKLYFSFPGDIASSPLFPWNEGGVFIEIGSPATSPVWAFPDTAAGPYPDSTLEDYPVSCLTIGGIPTVFWYLLESGEGGTEGQIYYSQLRGGVWGPKVLYYDLRANPPIDAGISAVGDVSQIYVTPSALNPSGISVLISVDVTIPALGSDFDVLFYLQESPSVISAQVAVQGISRFKAPPPVIGYQGCVDERTYTYLKEFLIAQAANADASPNGPLRFIVPIVDYDFDFYQLMILYQSSARDIPPTEVICTLQIFDYVNQPISNLPVLDIFYNGAPGTPYENGAIVPPLRYPKDGRIRVDLYSLVSDASLLPITAKFYFIGKKRIPA